MKKNKKTLFFLLIISIIGLFFYMNCGGDDDTTPNTTTTSSTSDSTTTTGTTDSTTTTGSSTTSSTTDSTTTSGTTTTTTPITPPNILYYGYANTVTLVVFEGYDETIITPTTTPVIGIESSVAAIPNSDISNSSDCSLGTFKISYNQDKICYTIIHDDDTVDLRIFDVATTIDHLIMPGWDGGGSPLLFDLDGTNNIVFYQPPDIEVSGFSVTITNYGIIRLEQPTYSTTSLLIGDSSSCGFMSPTMSIDMNLFTSFSPDKSKMLYNKTPGVVTFDLGNTQNSVVEYDLIVKYSSDFDNDTTNDTTLYTKNNITTTFGGLTLPVAVELWNYTSDKVLLAEMDDAGNYNDWLVCDGLTSVNVKPTDLPGNEVNVVDLMAWSPYDDASDGDNAIYKHTAGNTAELYSFGAVTQGISASIDGDVDLETMTWAYDKNGGLYSCKSGTDTDPGSSMYSYDGQ